MDIISEFELKLRNVGGEKVYSAREIMKIFGYDKWERFYGAISRAKDDLKDEDKINKNFFYVVNKETGGRPKEDVLLTLGACYLVLKKCDNRKENVVKLIKYLDNVLKEQKKIKSENKKIAWEKPFLILLVVFLIFSSLYYLNTYIKLFNIKIDEKGLDYNEFALKKELTENKKLEEGVFKEYDEKLNNLKTNEKDTITPNNQEELKESEKQNQVLDDNFDLILDNYISSGDNVLKKFDNEFNYRSDFVKNLVGEKLINSYFYFGNKKMYRDSCSILSPKNCLSSSKGDLKSFSNFWEKTKDGFKSIEVKKVLSESNKNIYCVSYKYKLKYDNSDNFLNETYNYTTQIKNGSEQIVGRFCEKIEKGGKKINCPFKLTNYYCK